MKGAIDKQILFTFLILFPCLLQGQINVPWWIDPDVRSVKYPSDTYYTGFAVIPATKNESFEQTVNRAKQTALGELSERILVTIRTDKQSKTVSTEDSNTEEQIRSIITSAVSAESQTEVAGSKIETYFNERTGEVYAFAYASKAELSSYYRNQIEFYLGKAENFLEIALDRLEKKEKRKASKQCEEALPVLDKVTYAQQLLSAVSFDLDEHSLQQKRSEDLHRRILQMIADLETGIYIFLDCRENIQNHETSIIKDRLPGLLTDNGCGCNFTDTADEADYTLYVTASIGRSNIVCNDIVFCWANAVVEIRNNYTNRTVKPKVEEVKSGNISYEAAAQKAFEKLAEDIAKQVIQYIK